MSYFFPHDLHLNKIKNTIMCAALACLSLGAVQAYADADPPRNTFLADSPWPMSHRNSYNQASSPLRGLEPGDRIDVDYTIALPSITLAYASDNVAWGSTFGSIYKVDTSTYWIKKLDIKLQSLPEDGISGAYSLVDKDGDFFAPRDMSLTRYGDAVEGDPKSDIVTEAIFDIPLELKTVEGEHIVGMNMTYDGHIALATSAGLVMTISRDFSTYQAISLGANQEVSNSIAVDEDGGIFVVTSKQMHRIQWNGETLSLLWSADYEAGPDTPLPGRLGIGSGSTPTLMGKEDEDKFVVFTDGGELMNLVLMWRDEIPADWQAIGEGKDRRIAAEFPITFGISDRTKSISEQSVMVRGHSAMVVDNEYSWDTSQLGEDPQWGMVTVLFSNLKFNAPIGVEKFSWKPDSREVVSDWSNQESCPNGIPTMSEASNLAYCWGQIGGKWTILGFDWNTGETKVEAPMGYLPKYNSTYAATQVVANRQIVGGTVSGVVRVQPK